MTSREPEDPIAAEIRRMSRRYALLPIHRVLLGHDGSMTRLLELIFCCTAKLKTIGQSVVPCPSKPARVLEIATGEPVNERDIVIVRGSDALPLLYARSYTPLARLKPAFKADLMRADVPIGTIMRKHRIEARREILTVGLVGKSNRLRGLLGQPGPYLFRTYNIITGEKPLITISEFLPASLFSARLPIRYT